jgi:hypothetical protein
MRDMTNQWERLRDSVTMAAQAPPPAPERAEPKPEEAAAEQPADKAPPERHDDLVLRIRELLGKYPEIGSRQLYDLALRMHPSLEEDGWRSFHARYVLPLKRERARAEGRMPKRRERKPVEKPPRKGVIAPGRTQPTAAATRRLESEAEQLARRARVRDVLLRLARQVAIAESRADLVDALARVEEMVDDVFRAWQPQESPNVQASEE